MLIEGVRRCHSPLCYSACFQRCEVGGVGRVGRGEHAHQQAVWIAIAVLGTHWPRGGNQQHYHHRRLRRVRCLGLHAPGLSTRPTQI